MDEISPQDAQDQFGIRTRHQQMPCGEYRFRLGLESGAGYCLTVAGDVGGWQKSHFHRCWTETYIVQQGWVLLATWEKGQGRVEKLDTNACRCLPSELPHNLYLPAGAKVHSVKSGDGQRSDWHDHKDLDRFCEGIELSQDETGP